MKRITFIGIMAVMVVMMAAGAAMAGSLSYSPGYLSINIAPGSTSSQTATISLVDAVSGEIVSFSGLTSYGLPAGWLSAPDQVRLDSINPSANIKISINAPNDAVEGRYTGILFPYRITAQGGRLNAGRGITVVVEVSAPKCSAAPGFSGLTADTTTIKVPNNKTYDVGVSGKVVNPEGCTLKSAWYTLTDEYGELGGTTKIQPAADGSFSASIPVKASRDGSDKDGRLYTITFGAENEAGTSAGMSLGVTVSHDQGKK